MGSAAEADCQLQLARDLEYLDAALHARLNAQIDEVKRMLSSLIRTIEGGARPHVREASSTYN
jgi:four helix bundle protein